MFDTNKEKDYKKMSKHSLLREIEELKFSHDKIKKEMILLLDDYDIKNEKLIEIGEKYKQAVEIIAERNGIKININKE